MLQYRKYYFSCPKFTILVETNGHCNDTIIDIAPIAKVFNGQPLENLKNWAERRFGEVIIEELNE